MRKNVFFLIITMAVFCLDSRFSYAAKRQLTDFIRVGLTKEFSEKTSLTLHNSELVLGFSKKDVFYPLEILRSKGGFVFRKRADKYFFLPGDYSSLEEVRMEILRLDDKEGLIFPAFSGLKNRRGRWRIVLSRKSERFKGLGEGIFRKDGMLFVESNEGSFFIDAIEAGGYPQFEAMKDDKKALIRLETNRYRGRMEIGSYGGGGLTAVNILRLEDYIKGVVPLEMGYTWHISAMKAQAVAARSFGLATAGFGCDSNLKKGYRLNNHSHQSYGGYDVEGKKPTRACKETAGEFVTYKNKVVRTFFYSTSGGATEFPKNVWGGKKAYLLSVPDIYENKPEKAPWTILMSKEEVRNRLDTLANKSGINLGEVLSLQILRFSESERVRRLKVIGKEGELILKDNEIREVFELPSTKFRVFEGGEAADEVFVASGENNSVKRERLQNKETLSKTGRSKPRLREENGGQLMTLSAGNRKGFYLGQGRVDYFTFVGSGFGHGVGLSQSGARGMAEAGFNYKEILKHYFKGTEIN